MIFSKILNISFIRKSIFVLIILVSGAYITNYFYGDKKIVHDYNLSFTKSCLNSKKLVVDDFITDVNCSLENNAKIIFYGLSKSALNELEQNIPVKSINFQCEPEFKLLSFSKRSSSKNLSDNDINLFIQNYVTEHSFSSLCVTDDIFFAKQMNIVYVDQYNSPHFTVIIKLPN